MSEEDIWSVPCHTQLLTDKPTRLALDCESSGVRWIDKAFGVSFAWYVGDELRSGYIDFRTHNDLWLEVKAWIREDKPELIAHNYKFDGAKLDLFVQNFQDTCLMVYILSENHPKSLKVLAARVLKEETNEAEVLKQTRRELGLTAADGYDKLPLSVVAPYAIKDSEYCLRLYLRLQKALEAEPDLVEVYEMEKQLLLAVAGTERRGIGVDTAYLRSKIVELGDEIVQLEREIATIVGKPVGDGKKKVRVPDGKYKNGNPKFRIEVPNEFNPNSPAQITAYFEAKGVTVSGTSEEALEAVTDPLATAIVTYRGLKKTRNTYLVPMLEESVWSEQYGCYVNHPNLNLTRTRTDRMSSSGASDG